METLGIIFVVMGSLWGWALVGLIVYALIFEYEWRKK